MSQSLQAYVTDPTSCAIDRAPIAAPMPPPRAQKHHEKAVARCAKSTVEFTRSAATRHPRAGRPSPRSRRSSAGRILREAAISSTSSPRPSARRHSARRDSACSTSPRRRARSPRSRRAGAASSCCRRRCARSGTGRIRLRRRWLLAVFGRVGDGRTRASMLVPLRGREVRSRRCIRPRRRALAGESGERRRRRARVRSLQSSCVLSVSRLRRRRHTHR